MLALIVVLGLFPRLLFDVTEAPVRGLMSLFGAIAQPHEPIDYHALLPELILAGTILVVLVVDLFLPSGASGWRCRSRSSACSRRWSPTLTLIGRDRATTFGGMFVVDNFALLFKVFFLSVALVVLLLSLRYFREGGFYQGEYYFLLLISFLGCLLMPSSRDLLMLFISLEMVSAPGFLMAAFRKGDPRANEAALKFFLIGVLSTAVMLYGMSLIYGRHRHATSSPRSRRGSATLGGQQETWRCRDPVRGGGLRVQGERGAVPVLGPRHLRGRAGAGGRVPGGGVEGRRVRGAAAADVRGVHGPAEFWAPMFAFLSVATMFVGNLVALQQRQVVRLLAYSGIAQAGYILLPFALAGRAGVDDHGVRGGRGLHLDLRHDEPRRVRGGDAVSRRSPRAC